MIAERFVVAPGAVVFPADRLPSSVQVQLHPRPGQYAITNTAGRAPTSLLSAETAALLECFREPASLAEAVMAFSEARDSDPHVVLDDAFGTLRELVGAGFLVAADDNGMPNGAPPTRVGRWAVTRVVQKLPDVSVLRGDTDDGQAVAIKLLRHPQNEAGRAALEREAAVLRLLDGCPVAPLIEDGSSADEPFIALGWLDATAVTDFASGWRRPWDREWYARTLELACAVLDAYATVHERRVVHGDVHPKNVLVCSDGVRLIDFGLSRVFGHPQLGRAHRGGVLAFREPEWVRAQLARRTPPQATAAGEQHALGALLYQLFTGQHFVRSVTDAGQLLERIARDEPRPFNEHGQPAWPEVEAVLARMLAKQPANRFDSVDVAARRLRAATPLVSRRSGSTGGLSPATLLKTTTDRLRRESGLVDRGLPTAPLVSVNYGAAGIAYFFYRLALAQGDPAHLASALRWLGWARRQVNDAHAFHASELGINPGRVGRISIYHSPAGVHCVDALVANATGDLRCAERAVAAFVSASRLPCASIDLTVGRASTIVGVTLLWEALRGTGIGERYGLLELGEETLSTIQSGLPDRVANGDSLRYRGVAHGWAGVLYSALRWYEATGASIPDAITERLEELAVAGRGVHDIPMAGWCHGPAGYAHLWATAARVLPAGVHAQRAVRAAEAAWASRERVPTLCCGLAGQAYAMLVAHQVTGEQSWVTRARKLAGLAVREVGTRWCLPNSLWKGDVGIALLASDLETPHAAAMPLFGNEGWPIPSARH